MALSDKVPFVLNEQYKSEDLNTLQDVGEAWTDDAAAFPTATRFTSTPAAAIPADELYPVVLGGLNASPSAGNVSIAAGVAVVPDLGADPNRPISQEVLARNAAATVVALPSPVTDTWYLITAAAVETSDAAVPRNRWVPANQAWESPIPSIVKRTRMALAFTVTAGTATQIPTSASRMPICAVFRPAGGGAVTTSQIVDLRPFADGGPKTPAVVLQRNLWRTNLFAASGATLLAISSRVIGPDGTTLWVEEAGLDPLGASTKDPSSGAASANQWWHLYLCPLPVGGSTRVFPRHAQAGLAGQQGILVLSRAAPNGRTNVATVNLPAPFNNFPCLAGKAACIGALKRDSGNTGWVGSQCENDIVRLARVVSIVTPNPALTLLTAGGDALSSDLAPLNARSVSYEFVVSARNLTPPGPTYARYKIDDAVTGVGLKLPLILVEQVGGYGLASDAITPPGPGRYAISVRAVLRNTDPTAGVAMAIDLRVNAVSVGLAFGQRLSADTDDYIVLNLSGVYAISAGQAVDVRVAAPTSSAETEENYSEISLHQVDWDVYNTSLDYTLAAGATVAVLTAPMDHTFHTLRALDMPLAYGSPLTLTKSGGSNSPSLQAVCESYRF